MTLLRRRQKEEIIQQALARATGGAVGPVGPEGPPGPPGGVTSYNGRTGAVSSLIGDIVAHHTTHENGAGDEINVGGLSGQLADAQPPIIGSGAAQAVAGNDARLTDARTPTAHTHPESDITNLVTDLAAKEVTANKGIASGYASLDSGGKVPNAQLPALAITNTFVVGSQAAMLALTAQTGDVAVRTDLSKNYILAGSDPTNLADWQELLTPADAVTSVAGKTGVVTLVEGDITSLTTDLAARVQIGGQLGNTAASPDVRGIRETGGPTLLTTGAIPDGQYLKRVGATVVGGVPTAAVSFNQAEVSLGSAPNARRNGKVQITGLSGLTIGKDVMVNQANGPYTGKGTRADEAEMDQVQFSGKVTAVDKIDLYWEANHRVRGNYRINYLVNS